MDTTDKFTTKAEAYARFRPDFALDAIDTILIQTGIGTQSVVADIGAGTGILTRHFVEKVALIYAVEPNDAMRSYAEANLGEYTSFRSLNTRAEETTIPETSVDLILVGQALDWFDPFPTSAEFQRIVKPGGFLAVISNPPEIPDTPLKLAVRGLFREEFGFNFEESSHPDNQPPNFYFGHDDFIHTRFPNPVPENWESFFGGICSASFAPDPEHPRFKDFSKAAREVFEQFQQDAVITMPFETELWLGKINR
jgi:SAM-dependent methyltransferase